MLPYRWYTLSSGVSLGTIRSEGVLWKNGVRVESERTHFPTLANDVIVARDCIVYYRTAVMMCRHCVSPKIRSINT